MLQDRATKKVLLTKQISPEGLELLTEVPWIETIQLTDNNSTDIESVLKQVHAIIARSFHVDKNMIQSAKQLKIIAQHGVGVDYIDVEAATEAGVYVTNAPRTNTTSVAEFTISLILLLSKQLINGMRIQKTGQYHLKDKCMGNDIENKVLGIIGFGNIGKKVAELAHGMGMKVVAYDPYVPSDVFEELHTQQITNLDDIFPISDYISLHMPGLETFRGMISEKQLDMMKDSAYLINCARGLLIDENALSKALKNNWIAGAALDVTCVEPLPEGNPLRDAPNLILTPHMAAGTKESISRMSVTAVKNVISALSDKVPENLVNPDVLEVHSKSES